MRPPWRRLGRKVASKSPSLRRNKRAQAVFDNKTRSYTLSEKDRSSDENTGRFLPAFLLKSNIVAPENFNRWFIPPAAVATHISIGSVYAWSVFNEPLSRTVGVVASSPMDWALSEVVPVFSTSIACLGLCAAVAGRWLEDVGPRAVGSIAALCWGGGFMVGSVGIMTHSLPLLYAGYGVLGGCGLGLGYVSPVSTLIRWFPDRRGMATGMAIMGFGGGAMIASPLKDELIRRNFRLPEYLGSTESVEYITRDDGRRFVEQVSGEMKEVIVASKSDLSKLPVDALEGVYVLGTGDSGVAATFMSLGLGYSALMLMGAFSYRIPREGWAPAGWKPPTNDEADKESMVTRHDVHIDTAIKTPQFWCLWTNLLMNVTAGIGVLGVAKTMMVDIFGTTMPTVVDATFAGAYVSMISVANMSGRFIWASASDYIGRKNTYYAFFGLGIPLYCSIPFTAQWVSASPGMAPLVMFTSSTMIIFSMYGGGFATIPAYLADMFGTKYVGGIHGRLLTAWSLAGIAGPVSLAQLRKYSVNQAIEDLTQKVDALKFEEKFGRPKEDLQMLIDSKIVSISRLMEIAPIDVIDPTPGLYNTTMYSMAGLLAVALMTNSRVRPVDPKYHMRS